MRNRSTVTAALALAAATILAIAACGSSVPGSAQPNQAAVTSAESETSQTSKTSETAARTSEDLSVPTDLSELTADLSALQSILPSDLSIPSDLSDLSIPSDLGLDSPCLTVGLAYASVGLALLPALGGTGTFDATQLQSAITTLASDVPSELAGDVQALAEVAQEANGKSLVEVSELLDSEKYTTATKHIEDWTKTSCGG